MYRHLFWLGGTQRQKERSAEDGKGRGQRGGHVFSGIIDIMSAGHMSVTF